MTHHPISSRVCGWTRRRVCETLLMLFALTHAHRCSHASILAGALATLNRIAHDAVGLEIMGRQQIVDKAGLVAHLRQVMLSEPNQRGVAVSAPQDGHPRRGLGPLRGGPCSISSDDEKALWSD